MLGSLLAGKQGVVAVAPDTSVQDVVATLHRHRIGAVLVMDGDRLAGLVSERDICACLHVHGSAILAETAADIMTSEVVTAPPSQTIIAAMAVMTDRRFRHLPIVEDGRVLGVVSIGDLVKRRIEDAEAEASALKDYITAS